MGSMSSQESIHVEEGGRRVNVRVMRSKKDSTHHGMEDGRGHKPRNAGGKEEGNILPQSLQKGMQLC